jgi:hypothetical protein
VENVVCEGSVTAEEARRVVPSYNCTCIEQDCFTSFDALNLIICPLELAGSVTSFKRTSHIAEEALVGEVIKSALELSSSFSHKGAMVQIPGF